MNFLLRVFPSQGSLVIAFCSKATFCFICSSIPIHMTAAVDDGLSPRLRWFGPSLAVVHRSGGRSAGRRRDAFLARVLLPFADAGHRPASPLRRDDREPVGALPGCAERPGVRLPLSPHRIRGYTLINVFPDRILGGFIPNCSVSLSVPLASATAEHAYRQIAFINAVSCELQAVVSRRSCSRLNLRAGDACCRRPEIAAARACWLSCRVSAARE
eukprot:GHVR01153554.1.p1 GENE.GHVR01153554.1~~GHVR01153554.1.p1  ORF type:complete len:215 (-),score=-2.41 GHVR01153554.1:616-1260(-)